MINFALSYLVMSNIMIYDPNHIHNNLNKVYMGIFMASLMGLAELWVMPNHMLNPQSLNLLVITLIFVTILTGWMIRRQTLINDNQFLKSMIEHHSGAVLMASKILSKTQNKQVFDLANSIIQSQIPEINSMTEILQSNTIT